MYYEVKDSAIVSFSGKFRFLSNFYLCQIAGMDEVTYPSVEHAFQAQKTLSLDERIAISELSTPTEAKAAGRALHDLREDWEDVKLDVMLSLLSIKFSDDRLGRLLLSTGRHQLVEGNTWGDRFWGCVRECGAWYGHNHLGEKLMTIRALLRNERDYGSK